MILDRDATHWLISDLHILTVHLSSLVMAAANQEAQPSSNAIPFRQGALDAAEIRHKCPQFRILIIGKANAGKTTILRKVCNAKPDKKPIIYNAKGKEVRQESTMVCPENLQSWHKLTQTWGHYGSPGCSPCLSFCSGGRDNLQMSKPFLLMSSILLLRLSESNPVYNYFLIMC